MKKKNFKVVVILLLILLLNTFVFRFCNLKSSDVRISMDILSDKLDYYQLFYSTNSEWSEENSQKVEYLNVGNKENIQFIIPKDTKFLRFDIGNNPANINIENICIEYFGNKVFLDIQQFTNTNNYVQIESIQNVDSAIYVKTVGSDPYFIYHIDEHLINNLLSYEDTINFILKIVICIIVDLLLFLSIRKSKSISTLVNELKSNRRLIFNLSINDFKTKYAGSYLGITWAFVQPVVTILVYWFVFEFGLKAGSPIVDVPFILWFSVGLIPWFFFSEALNNATNCMIEYSYLVKKLVFKISILPIIKIISALFVHLVFICFVVIVCFIYKFYPTIYMIQLLYYTFCLFFLILALSYATASIVLFFRDLGQIINIFLQIGMWMTPIMWSYTIVPEKFQWIVKLNPLYYIVEGYRDTFINKIWFFEKYFQTIYFWIIAIGLFGLGALIFKKLKLHFADVL